MTWKPVEATLVLVFVGTASDADPSLGARDDERDAEEEKVDTADDPMCMQTLFTEMQAPRAPAPR